MALDIKRLLNPEVYNHPTKNIELMETHISWVILTGDFAYKIKKPVNFGFLDFSTLEKRHDFCDQELRLNSRLASSIYLDVIAITLESDKLSVSGGGDIIEYAVKMAQFPQSAQLDNMLSAGALKIEHMDAIAHMVANFHQSIDIADHTTEYGNSDTIFHPVEENFIQIDEHLDTDQYVNTLDKLQSWSKSTFVKLKSFFEQRKRDGFIRECHGDMHLRNMLWLDEQAIAFDCIEFNPQLRWIDVISDIAFLVMDLQDRQQHQLANRFLNTYLEISGDYAGLPALSFYLCYRALVRAKVNALRLDQKNTVEIEREKTLVEFESYLELAMRYVKHAAPKLIITRGLSASGKSTVSQQLVDNTGFIRIRSDVERKRLFNASSAPSAVTQPSTTKTQSGAIDSGIYSAQASQQTYAKLAELAEKIINAGYSAIVDAAFLTHVQRESFQQLASRSGVTYIIIELTAPADLLRQRINSRKHDVSDADITILEHQLSNWTALHEDELSVSISVSTATALDINLLIEQIESH